MINKIGNVDINKGWDFCRNLDKKLIRETWNNRINSSGRICHWIGYGARLGFNNNIFKGEEISKGLRLKGNELWGGEDWNSILIYRYDKGVELKNHIDRNIFEEKTIIVNFCKQLTGFNYNEKIYWLKDGEVIEINNQLPHGVLRVTETRYSLQFRKIKGV
jgi:hypothetical protein